MQNVYIAQEIKTQNQNQTQLPKPKTNCPNWIGLVWFSHEMVDQINLFCFTVALKWNRTNRVTLLSYLDWGCLFFPFSGNHL